jgi:DNA-binding response OmpR family regulator
MKIPICETCKRPLPIDGIANSLPPTKRKIYEAIVASGARGLSRTEIMDKVYEDREDGGAERSDRVKVNISQINRTLREEGAPVCIRWSLGQYRVEASA